MKEDLGDFIYFAIIVITFVISAIKGIKKKKKEEISEPSDPNTPSQPHGYELIDYPDPDSDEVPYEEPVVPKPVVPFSEAILQMKQQPIEFKQPKSSMTNHDEGSRNADMKRYTKKQVAKARNNEEYLIDDVDDMRKAFVYSEIFNRKY